jgi:hypothetical protein
VRRNHKKLKKEDVIMAEGKEKEEGKGKSAGEKLIAAACEAYGIAPKYVLASRIDTTTGEAVIVTYGGSKVRFKADAKVAPLDQIAITGINPKPKRKPIAGKE